jgi:hypothetical protein
MRAKKGAERPNLELVNRLRDDEFSAHPAARESKRRKLRP